MTSSRDEIRQLLTVHTARANAVITAIVSGLLCGVLLWLATVWLVMKGGEEVGPHLALLAQYFPGYRVSLAGSFLGLAYGFAIGFGAGYLCARLYNALAQKRERNDAE